MIFFSDWFGEISIFDIVKKVDVGNLSLQNSDDFFLDFAYMAARSYYTQPMSRDYAYSELYSINYFSDDEEDYAELSRNALIFELMYAHIQEYGDDYIEVPDGDEYQTDNISDSDFDLLELELDEMMVAKAFEMEDADEYESEDNDDFFGDVERINAEDISSEILDDPVKLLDWLRKNERLKKDEPSESW